MLDAGLDEQDIGFLLHVVEQDLQTDKPNKKGDRETLLRIVNDTRTSPEHLERAWTILNSGKVGNTLPVIIARYTDFMLQGEENENLPVTARTSQPFWVQVLSYFSGFLYKWRLLVLGCMLIFIIVSIFQHL